MTGPPTTVAHAITRLDVGGAQETVVRVCAGLDRRRFRPVILAGADAGSGGSLRPQAEAADVPVVTVPALRGANVGRHPAQHEQASFDQATGTFTVPARTTAVFVQR